MEEAQHPALLRYKVISIENTKSGWRQLLEDELNRLAALGYRPILYGDAGNQSTAILEKIDE